jgi:SRSO17 transposase
LAVIPLRAPSYSRRASRLLSGGKPSPEEWLLIEWHTDESVPSKYWLATVADDIAFHRLVVELAKLRWRIERDYQELKQQIGLRHYQGRGR